MSDESKYRIEFSGTFAHSQFGVGDHVELTMNAGAVAESRLTAEQLGDLRNAIRQLADDVNARAPEDRREAALEQVQELADATISADEVDVPRLKRITSWFASNAPDLAAAVTGLLFGPAVSALVGQAGGLAVAFLGGEPDS
jgi:aminoglycoside phosphotransferase (APT) family kinase protein